MATKAYDALVIGAGAGGLFSAALLAHRGYRTLLVEKSDIVGGRASTRYVDGFAINTGALGIEIGNEFEQVFNEVGAELRLRRPDPGIVIRVGSRNLNISTGVGGVVARTATRLLGTALKYSASLRPKSGENVTEWVSRFTKNTTIHGVVHNFVGSVFAASPQLLSADTFLHYVTEKGAFKKFGFSPGGTIKVWDTLLESFQCNGGELWLNSEVKKLTFDVNGNADGAIITRQGLDLGPKAEQEIKVTSAIVVSDIGPVATLPLCDDASLPAEYSNLVKRAQPSAIISVYFASQKPLLGSTGFTCFSKTKRLCYATSFNNCPENSPPGWYIYNGASVPQPCVGEIDIEAETELLMCDLREQFPGFDQARLLDIVVTQGDWPAQRVVAGNDLPHSTPVTNLWNVGDAIKQRGSAATAACAETALIVADEITNKIPLNSLPAKVPETPAVEQNI